ncbi:MAG: DUF3572 domain-containing protein [Proteobacteria bacterium]|nr:DUF3572 domain-containing protein [Pseudomonadota bacterium]
MNEEQAKIIALQALTYLVGNPSALQRFFDLSGVDASDLRLRADDPAMLAGVLDFFLGNEAQLLEMCQAMDMSGEMPARARRRLSGGDGEEWS